MTKTERRIWTVSITVALAVAVVGVKAWQVPESAEVRLGAALHKEQVEGNCEAAIPIYSTVAADRATSRPVAARALLQLAGCYAKLGRPEAAPTYRKIVTDYGDSGAIAAAASAKLASLLATSASPFKSKSLDAFFPDEALTPARPTPSADGRVIAYIRAVQDKSAGGTDAPAEMLCVRDLTTGHERVLVDSKNSKEPFNGRPAWSPDGRQIAYVVGTANDKRELRLVGTARADVRRVGTFDSGVTSISWSPDSARLTFVVHKEQPGQVFELHVFTLASGQDRLIGPLLAPNGGPVWAPDGQRLAYVPGDAATPNAEIAVITAASADRRVIRVPAPGPNGQTVVTDWLPGGQIAFRQFVPEGSNDRFLVPESGGEPRKICDGRGRFGGDGCGGITWDGRFQIVRQNVSGGGRTVLRDLATGQDRPLTNDAVSEQTVQPPGRNGKLLIFKSNRDGRYGIYVVPVDRTLVDHPVWIADLDTPNDTASGWWTPDGLVLRVDSSQENIYRVDMDPSGRANGRPRRLTQDAPVNQKPRPSLDGRQIAYTSRDGGTVGVALMDANGANERLVFRSPPALMPIGQNLGWRSASEVVLFPTGGTDQRPVSLVNVSTGTTTPHGTVAGQGKDYMSALDEIVHWGMGDAKASVVAMSVATGRERSSAKLPDDAVYFALTPDGQSVIFTTERDGGPGKVPQGDFRIRAFSGGEERVLMTFVDTDNAWNATPLSVSPNGRFLVYQDVKSALRIMDIETTKSWPLLLDPPAGVKFDWSDAEWAPDGSYLLLEGSQRHTTWRQFQGVTYDAVVKMIDSQTRRDQ